MAQALGLELPAVEASATALVSTDTLWRTVGISSLDLRKREARVLLQRLLEVEQTDTQRAAGSGSGYGPVPKFLSELGAILDKLRASERKLGPASGEPVEP